MTLDELVGMDEIKNTEKIAILREALQSYGLVHLDTPAQPNVDEYMYWDEWHYTRVTHRILGETMFDTYKEIK